jgi:Kelch motif
MIRRWQKILLCFISTTGLTAHAQVTMQWRPLPALLMAVSNNAVCAATIADTVFVYSFGGIDSSKKYGGITQRSFRYNTILRKWKEIRPLPDVLGKIASAAATIKNKIYIAGGYHVLPDGKEISSSRLHIYDPATDTYTEGAPVPGGIDDQVQAVWKDSLLYIITGWSQNGNVSTVQVYNPVSNTWQKATSVPETKQYKVFGGSGVIIADTIYYAGGAYHDKHYPLGAVFRKGVINKDDPTQIEWSIHEDSLALGYRMAAIAIDNIPYWIGGSAISYNYNGIAYNGSGGVAALSRVMWYHHSACKVVNNQLPRVMDMRGAARVGENKLIIAGGITDGQAVSSRCWLITIINSH